MIKNLNSKEWTEEEDEILRQYLHKVNINNIPLDRSKNAIQCRAGILKLTKSKNSNWTHLEDKILLNNYDKISTRNLSLKLNRSIGAIHGRASFLNIKSNNIARRKYNVNHDFFSIINNKSSYFAGLLAADGCIKNTSTISIALTDEELINSFKKCINYDGPIYNKQKRPDNYSYKLQYELRISSKNIVKDLEKNFNIIPKKSLILQPPLLDNIEHQLAFIIGYIDGDGCISITKQKQLYFMCCGSFDMMSWIGNMFNRTVRLNGKSKTNFKIEAKCKPALDILSRLYSIETPIKLSRKWDKIKELINVT